MLDSLEHAFLEAAPAVDFCALRFVEETSEHLTVRQNVPEPPCIAIDRGAMVTVIDRGGLGYAATTDLSLASLRAALQKAWHFARLTQGRSLTDYSKIQMPRPHGRYRSPQQQDASRLSLAERFELLSEVSRQTKIEDRIVDWAASLSRSRTVQLYLTADRGRAEQTFDYLVPSISATAHANGETQTRSLGGRHNGFCQQGGLEILERARFREHGPRVAEEALQLLAAPNCPSGAMDLLLMPDQMMLQIHETIGHPLELDRILGDERNFAGTSFVTLDMFGTYRYGSDVLTVTFDPTRVEEFASYAFDDDGSPAEKQYLIRRGILQCPLGGAVSQARARQLRADISGAPSSRASSWNRPPIDRIANLNIEPGQFTLEEIIKSIENGVLMQTNVSWSIDDSRKSFQFGCEYGRRIRNGQVGEVVKNPNYRGISTTFWRSLAMVGNTSTFEVLGAASCGKGEPPQLIRVGHASPACKFTDVEVFGGAD